VLGELIGEAAKRFGDAPAYVTAGGWTVTYADVDRLSDEVASGFQARGVRKGDVVALALPAIPEYPIAYLAAAKIGAITAGINPRLSAPERRSVLEVASPRLVVATEDLATEDLASERAEVITPGISVETIFAGLCSSEPPKLVADDPATPVVIVFTSGTTGTPKGALFCNRQLTAITSIDVGDRWGGGGRTLVGTAMAHLGFMTKFPGNVRQGGCAWLTPRWRATEALEFTAANRLTSVAGIPTQVALMLQVPEFDGYDLSSVKAIVVGGGPATPALVEEARRRFDAALMVRYSCTEAAIGIGTRLDDPPEDALVSVGRPLPGVSLALLDDSDRPVALGEVGAVCLRSAAVMSGYWHDEPTTKATFTDDGFVRTGDLGWLDDAGRLHLAGRSKEMYVRGGYNVYPMEVEGVLAEHPAVTAVAVVARPDDVMGEVGVAFVVPRGDGPSLAALRSFGADRLAAYKLPEDIRMVEALPLTSMDKVDRKALAALLSS